MKKNLIVLVLVLIFIPLQVNAVSIKDTAIMGRDEVNIGTEFSLSFRISFDGIRKGDPDSLGLAAVSHELIYDDSVFTITDITSNGYWDSTLYKENGKYYIVSQVGENNADQNKCVDKVLYCADYLVTVNFFVRNTDKTNSDIKIGEIEVGLLNMLLDLDKEINEDDVVLVSGHGNSTQSMKIKEFQANNENKNVEEPQSIVSNEKPKLNDETLNLPKEKVSSSTATESSNNKNETSKSTNNYLSSLKIKKYEIDFDKNKKEYTVNIDKEVNKLEVELELEDSKATYNIIGADDLEKNNNKVIIEVFAESGDKNTYTIDLKKETDENVQSIKQEKNNKINFKLDKKYITIGGIIVGSIIIIVIIIFILIRIRDRKVEKELDSL